MTNPIPADAPQVVVLRSRLDSRVWVAVPANLDVDQSYAQYPGGLRAVQEWARDEYATGLEVTWTQVDADKYVMTWDEEQ